LAHSEDPSPGSPAAPSMSSTPLHSAQPVRGSRAQGLKRVATLSPRPPMTLWPLLARPLTCADLPSLARFAEPGPSSIPYPRTLRRRRLQGSPPSVLQRRFQAKPPPLSRPWASKVHVCSRPAPH
jgi:hypothetical protein